MPALALPRCYAEHVLPAIAAFCQERVPADALLHPSAGIPDQEVRVAGLQLMHQLRKDVQLHRSVLS